MIGGQYLDTMVDGYDLAAVHRLKTGRLFYASVTMALWAAELPEAEQAPWRAFAEELGLLFQIVDDILDADGYVREHGAEARAALRRRGRRTGARRGSPRSTRTRPSCATSSTPSRSARHERRGGIGERRREAELARARDPRRGPVRDGARLDVTNVSISQIVADLTRRSRACSTAITMYTLVMAAFMLVGAKLGDMYGRDRIFAIGLGVYEISSQVRLTARRGSTATAGSRRASLRAMVSVEGLGPVLADPCDRRAHRVELRRQAARPRGRRDRRRRRRGNRSRRADRRLGDDRAQLALRLRGCEYGLLAAIPASGPAVIGADVPPRCRSSTRRRGFVALEGRGWLPHL